MRKVSTMRVVLYITGLFVAGMMMIATAIPANAVGLDAQMKINKNAVKIADKTCGKWSPSLSQTRRDCRFKVLTRNGFVPLYDAGEVSADPNTVEFKRLAPKVRPVADTYATW